MKADSEKGAALLDVLIALAITAMIAAALTQATRFGLTVVERAQTANAKATTSLIDRRRIHQILSRIDPATLNQPSVRVDASGLFWRGPVDDEHGVWRARSSNQNLVLSKCDGFDERAACTQLETLSLPGDITLAAPDGVFVSDWPLGPLPHLIRIGDIVIQPRVLGASR